MLEVRAKALYKINPSVKTDGKRASYIYLIKNEKRSTFFNAIPVPLATA